MPITVPCKAGADWRSESSFSEKVNDVSFERPRAKSVGIACQLALGAVVFWVCFFFSLGQLIGLLNYDPLRPTLGTLPSWHTIGTPSSLMVTSSKEAYVLFLPSVARIDYVDSIRLLLYGFKHDLNTRDTSNRDVIIISTSQVPLSVEDQLRGEGAIVIRDTRYTTSFPSHLDTQADQRLQRDIDIALLWNLTQYERVIWVDGESLMVRSIEGIWEETQEGHLFVIPDAAAYQQLSLATKRDGDMGSTVIGGLSAYFTQDDPHMWSILDTRWAASVSTEHDFPSAAAILYLVHTVDRSNMEWNYLRNYKLGKMRGYWAARDVVVI